MAVGGFGEGLADEFEDARAKSRAATKQSVAANGLFGMDAVKDDEGGAGSKALPQGLFDNSDDEREA